MASSLFDLIDKGHKMILIFAGPRGDFEKLARARIAASPNKNIDFINPDFLDPQCQAWLIDEEVKSPLDIRQFAALIVAKLKNTNEFFEKGVMGLVTTVISRLYEMSLINPKVQCDLRTICLICQDRLLLRRFVFADKNLRKKYAAHLAAKGRLSKDFFASISQAIEDFSTIAAGYSRAAGDGVKGNRMSVESIFTTSNSVVVHLPVSIDKTESYRPLTEAFLRKLIEKALSNRGDPETLAPTIFIFDEVHYQFKFLSDALKDLFNRLRTFGRGNKVGVAATFQTKPSLDDSLGRDAGDDMWDNFQNKVMYQCHNRTAREMAEDVGKEEVYIREKHTPISKPPVYTRETRHVIPPQKFSALPLANRSLDRIQCYVRLNAIQAVWLASFPFVKFAEWLRTLKLPKQEHFSYEDLKLDPFDPDEMDALGLLSKKQKAKMPGHKPNIRNKSPFSP